MYNMNGGCEINKQDLLNSDEEEEDENKKLKDFYERNLQFLKNYPDKSYLEDIARMLHKTFLGNVEWRKYAASLGITDSDELDKIEVRAEKYHEQELYVVFSKILPRKKTFDHVIRMLINEERFDVLKNIYSVAEGLIEKSRYTEVKRFPVIELQPNYEQWNSTACYIQEINSETSSNSNDSYKIIIDTCVPNHPAYIKKEFNDLQQSAMNDYCTAERIIPSSTVFQKFLKQSVPTEGEIIPSAPVLENPDEGKIFVFIQHTKYDTKHAEQLSNKFKNGGFKVKAMSDMDVSLTINETALCAIYREVDFIVPVISESFLRQIYAIDVKKFIDFNDANNNRYFYQLTKNEYKMNNYYNFKVRPVIMPGMMKQKLEKDIVLSFPFRFGVEDDKLIRVLKETKDLISQYS